MLGFDSPKTVSELCPPMTVDQRLITIVNGKRTPNPCVCFAEGVTSYLYDKMIGAARFYILIFVSDTVRGRIACFSHESLCPAGVFVMFGGTAMFNLVLVLI